MHRSIFRRRKRSIRQTSSDIDRFSDKTKSQVLQDTCVEWLFKELCGHLQCRSCRCRLRDRSDIHKQQEFHNMTAQPSSNTSCRHNTNNHCDLPEQLILTTSSNTHVGVCHRRMVPPKKDMKGTSQEASVAASIQLFFYLVQEKKHSILSSPSCSLSI